MKLLLTSAGITNETIKSAFLDMLEKAPEESKVAFIPTAADIEPGHKDWFIDGLNSFFKIEDWAQFDIVDIAALERVFWEPRLMEADILCVGGGNEFFLMYHIQKSGLADILPELLKSKVWVGISSGAMVIGKKTSPELSKFIYDEETAPPFDKVERFLEYVDFSLKPHMNSSFFPKASESNLDKYAPDVPHTFYGIDDQTAIKVIDDRIEIVSEGKWKKYN